MDPDDDEPVLLDYIDWNQAKDCERPGMSKMYVVFKKMMKGVSHPPVSPMLARLLRTHDAHARATSHTKTRIAGVCPDR